MESIAHTPGSERRDSLPVSFNKRKRKRFSIRAAADLTPLGASGKRRSSVSDAGLSVSGSFLDYTASPSCKHESKGKYVNHIEECAQEKVNCHELLGRPLCFCDYLQKAIRVIREFAMD